MNLYLSSYRIGNSGAELARLAQGKRALVVSNALDFSEDLERLKFARGREIGWLAELGIAAEALDLRDYFSNKETLRSIVNEAGMLWVVGGNTFLLRKAMFLSELDEILQEKVNDPTFLYAGYSAGVCVLSPSLRGIHLADEPEAKSMGYKHETIWAGLGILEDYIVPHYRCDHWESESMEAVVGFYEENSLPYRTLSDGEVIVESTEMHIVVTDYQAEWAEQFETLSQGLVEAVGGNAIAIEHVGSTSVVGLPAKPIIDIDIIVTRENVASTIAILEGIGYEHRGDLGVEDREAFFNPTDTTINHHLYVCVKGSLALKNHLLLRDSLRRDPEKIKVYGELKKQLAAKYPDNIDAYIAGKTEFILGVFDETDLSESEISSIREANMNIPIKKKKE